MKVVKLLTDNHDMAKETNSHNNN